MSKTSARTLVVRTDYNHGSPRFRITLPREFVEENRRRIVDREFEPTISSSGNIVLRRV
ncbi:MAG: hypothetical protein AABY22_29360 [Nanoarchaeota archaeon]